MKCKKYEPPFVPLDPSEFDEPYRRNYVPGGKITPMLSDKEPVPSGNTATGPAAGWSKKSQ